MKHFVALLFAISVWAETITFDSAVPGGLPAGWISTMTHAGGEPDWRVIADPGAPSRPHVLAQLSTDKTNGRYPLAIYGEVSRKDGTLSVRFRPVSGEVDRAAGLVWRYRDPDNYYLVRANALENNVVLYKVEGGKRTSLVPKGAPEKTYGVKHPVPAGVWSTLKVDFQGSLFTVFLDNQKLFEVEDHTFAEAGRVGLWTKADSVTYFDDFKVE